MPWLERRLLICARPSKTTTEKRKIIERLKPNHALNDLLRVAKMPRSSFYYKEIKRNYHEVKEAILSLYKKNKKRDGYRPMTFKLRQMGFNLNHKTVLKLMNELGIHSILRKKDMENVEKHRILPRIC